MAPLLLDRSGYEAIGAGCKSLTSVALKPHGLKIRVWHTEKPLQVVFANQENRGCFWFCSIAISNFLTCHTCFIFAMSTLQSYSQCLRWYGIVYLQSLLKQSAFSFAVFCFIRRILLFHGTIHHATPCQAMSCLYLPHVQSKVDHPAEKANHQTKRQAGTFCGHRKSQKPPWHKSILLKPSHLGRSRQVARAVDLAAQHTDEAKMEKIMKLRSREVNNLHSFIFTLIRTFSVMFLYVFVLRTVVTLPASCFFGVSFWSLLWGSATKLWRPGGFLIAAGRLRSSAAQLHCFWTWSWAAFLADGSCRCLLVWSLPGPETTFCSSQAV